MPTGGFHNPTELEPGSDYETACRQWTDWIRLSSKQRLLVATIVLRTQKASLLARGTGQLTFQATDLPFPCAAPLWDALSAVDWVDLMQLNSSSPRCISEALEDSSIQRSVPYDPFQSAVLIAGCYNADVHSIFLSLCDSDSFEQGLAQGYQSQMLRHATLLSQNAPVRALLAVSGESWILNEKLEQESFAAEKRNLRIWLDESWTVEAYERKVPVMKAVKQSIHVLRLCVDASEEKPPALPLHWEMMAHISVLVLWAIAHRVSEICKQLGPAPGLNTVFSSPGSTHHSITTLSADSPDHMQRVRDFLGFADEATNVSDLRAQWYSGSVPLAQWRLGVTAMLQWVSMRLEKANPDQRSRSDVLSAAINSLSRLCERGWEPGWF